MKQWKSWGASVPGPAHLRNGLPNQDAWCAHHYEWGDVLVVSDGLGSCPRADVGSLAACNAVNEAADFCFKSSSMESPDLPHVIQILWRLLVYPLPPQECSATCLFVIREENGTVHFGMLGDGLLAAVKKNGEVELVTDDKSDSFSNFTSSLSSASPANDWKIRRAPEDIYSGFLLCSDGIADDLMPESTGAFVQAVVERYKNYSENLRTEELHSWLNSWPVPGHADDKTIACLYRKEGIS